MLKINQLNALYNLDLRNELENGRLEQDGNLEKNLHDNSSQNLSLKKDTNPEANNPNRKYISFDNLPMNLHEDKHIDSYDNHSKYYFSFLNKN